MSESAFAEEIRSTQSDTLVAVWVNDVRFVGTFKRSGNDCVKLIDFVTDSVSGKEILFHLSSVSGFEKNVE